MRTALHCLRPMGPILPMGTSTHPLEFIFDLLNLRPQMVQRCQFLAHTEKLGAWPLFTHWAMVSYNSDSEWQPIQLHQFNSSDSISPIQLLNLGALTNAPIKRYPSN